MAGDHHIVVFCNCSYTDIIPATVRNEVRAGLEKSGFNCIFMDDLCGVAAVTNNTLNPLREYDRISIIACFPRAVKWLFHAAGIKVEGKDIRYYNMRNTDSKTILASVCAGTPPDQENQRHLRATSEKKEWLPWFPVIDYDRCKTCGQCFNFCIFGVYDQAGDGTIRVVKPANCKAYCPACARICPEAAIMFPKIAEEPINGAEITDEQHLKTQIKINVDEILGNDIYAALAERRKKARKNLLKTQDIGRAEQERDAYSENHSRNDGKE